MKFAEHLTAHITPEWRKQYINYEEMKAMLYVAVEEAPSAESVEEEIRRRHYANFDESFFHYCDQELKKINTFYSGMRPITLNRQIFGDDLKDEFILRSNSKPLINISLWLPDNFLPQLAFKPKILDRQDHK